MLVFDCCVFLNALLVQNLFKYFKDCLDPSGYYESLKDSNFKYFFFTFTCAGLFHVGELAFFNIPSEKCFWSFIGM